MTEQERLELEAAAFRALVHHLMEKRPDEANKHLAQLESICGNKTCPEYVTLAKAIADYRPAQK